MTTLCSLTEQGVAEAHQILTRIREGDATEAPFEGFQDPRYVTHRGPELPPVDLGQMSTRWGVALWLYRSLGEHNHLLDPPTWSWLALHLFDVICPITDGRRIVREAARYLLQADDYRKAHRHLLAGPYLLFMAHADDPAVVRGLLATSPDAPGEVYEQLASRKFLITSRAVASTATRLYLNAATGRLRRGAGGSGAGSPRRLSEVLQQFDRTYDLQTMTPETLLSILPSEFDRFLRT